MQSVRSIGTKPLETLHASLMNLVDKNASENLTHYILGLVVKIIYGFNNYTMAGFWSSFMLLRFSFSWLRQQRI